MCISCVNVNCVANQMVGVNLAGMSQIKDVVDNYRGQLSLDVTFTAGFGIGTVVRNKKGRIGVVVAMEVEAPDSIKLSYVYADDTATTKFKKGNFPALLDKFTPLGNVADFDFAGIAMTQKKAELQAQLADLQAQIAQL